MADYQALAPLSMFFYIFLIILALLWFFLPFAIFGTKDKLQELIKETIATREAINELTDILKNK